MTSLMRSTGTANPMFWAPGRIAVVIPMTCPHGSSSGPPEFPGLIDASVWIIGSASDHAAPGTIRLTAETIPRVSVWSNPSGLPIAYTSTPTANRDESPSVATGSDPFVGGGILMSAMSKIGSAPMSFAGRLVPSSSVTVMTWRPNTTCELVRISPEDSMMTPEPATRSMRRSMSYGLIEIAPIDTTDCDTWSKSAGSDSGQPPAPAVEAPAGLPRRLGRRLRGRQTAGRAQRNGECQENSETG